MSSSIPSRSMNQQPKQISSRLLNMKFMQRAAAADKSKSTSSPQTPGSAHPRFKRRRTDDDLNPSGHNSPSTPGTPFDTTSHSPFGDPSSATKPHAPLFTGGPIETPWVLNIHPQATPTSTTQYNLNDDDDDDDDDEDDDDIWNNRNAPSGRQIYGSLKRKKNTSTPATPANQAHSPHAQSHAANQSKFTKRNAKNKSRSSSKPALGGVDLLIEDSDDDGDEDGDSQESEADTASSDDSDDDESDDGHPASRRSEPTKPPIDFMSEEYTRKLDNMDFRSSGFGKQRPGLSGGGGGGGGGGTGSSGKGSSGRRSQGNTPKNRNRLGGQGVFERGKNKQRKSM